MEIRALIIASVLAVLHVFLTRRELIEYREFQGYAATEPRQRMLRTWLLRSMVVHGAAAVLVLFAVDRSGVLMHLAPELQDLSMALRPEGDGRVSRMVRSFSLVVPVLLLVMPTAITVLDVRRRTVRGERLRDDPAVQGRNVSSLFPRNATERRWTTLLSLNAGVSEELFFRAMLPVLLVLATGHLWVGVVLSVLAFGAAHLYQGVTGVVVTTFVGALFMLIYLVSGELWLVVAIHAALDLNGLALAPWLEERWLGSEDRDGA